MKYRNILIAGGSGFLGKTLVSYFAPKVDKIIVLSRKAHPRKKNVEYVKWDGISLGFWTEALEGADVLINLSGKSVDCRYNEKNKKEILESRVNSTTALGLAINQTKKPPKLWINSSTATIYRHSLDKQMDELNGEVGTGFSVNVAKAWEESFFSFDTPSTRKVAIRTGIVLGKNGGAFVPLKKLAKSGFAGKQGPGTQFVSWIHAFDFARSIDFIIKNKTITGTINIVAPTPIQNTRFMKKIRREAGALIGIPLKTKVLELGALIIKTETELILKSRNVIPRKLMEAGFRFRFPKLNAALRDLLAPKS